LGDLLGREDRQAPPAGTAQQHPSADAASEPSQPRRRQHEARRLLDQEHIRLQVLDGLDERGEVAAQLPEVPAEDPQAPGLARRAALPSPPPSTIGAMTRSTRPSSSATP